jgi:hypothetical protein
LFRNSLSQREEIKENAFWQTTPPLQTGILYDLETHKLGFCHKEGEQTAWQECEQSLDLRQVQRQISYIILYACTRVLAYKFEVIPRNGRITEEGLSAHTIETRNSISVAC